jgi:hypothetical protein
LDGNHAGERRISTTATFHISITIRHRLCKDFVVLERSPLSVEINFICEGFEENETEEFEYSS